MFSIFNRKPGHKPDFAKVVDQELEVLFRIARQLTGNDTDAEDLVGQTLLQATKAWDRFDGSYPRGWLIKILRNEHPGSIRYSQSRPTIALEETAEPAETCYWKEIDWQVVGKDIMRILQMLPEEFRLVISLCDIEDLTRDEVAIVLAIPVGTINSRLHRARKMLRTKIIEELGDLSIA